MVAACTITCLLSGPFHGSLKAVRLRWCVKGRGLLQHPSFRPPRSGMGSLSSHVELPRLRAAAPSGTDAERKFGFVNQ